MLRPSTRQPAPRTGTPQVFYPCMVAICCISPQNCPQQPCKVGRPGTSYSHFIGEETEAQSSQRVCPESPRVRN